jgi:hypothetical protein
MTRPRHTPMHHLTSGHPVTRPRHNPKHQLEITA